LNFQISQGSVAT